ncbi:MAG: NAD(P)/FAD-dependent oxidoreductase [Oscillospiraceae bacterium]|nr:NAD(P)/FAD-dependent oxidoreductase [Oscillospiraceae bacterium]
MHVKSAVSDVVVVGSGPAGLSAAIAASESGAHVTLIDENKISGGQLFKQIHKFFGSEEYYAGIRGFDIAKRLVDKVGRPVNKDAKTDILLNSIVYGIFPGFKVGVAVKDTYNLCLETKKIIVCTGASENALSFENSTLPGVIGAGAAQTLMNIYKVSPGSNVLMVGSGNVGLIVSYQLLQAGVRVAGIVELLDKVGGYSVHAAKVRRAGVPIWTNTTIIKALGKNSVSGARIASVDSHLSVIEGTERDLDVDLICLACGLRPMTELLWMTGCEHKHSSVLGGHVPLHDKNMETTIEGLYVAGDAAGIEEASIAMEEGRLAGIAAAESLGYIKPEDASVQKEKLWENLNDLRSGYHGSELAKAKSIILEGKRCYT